MSENVFEQQTALCDSERRELTGHSGQTLWFTGLSSSGKSTVAVLLERLLLEKGHRAYLLDGDNLRLGLNSDLGFSASDRTENIRRISETAALFAHSGTAVITGAISPFAKDRAAARRICSRRGAFTEIYINTPLEECMRRDVKGLYKRAMSGEIREFTGISSPYEPPEAAELVINTAEETPEEAASRILLYSEALMRLHTLILPIKALTARACEAVMQVYASDNVGVTYKDDSSPLTRADIASNEIICEGLKKLCPDIPILSEETKDDPSRLNSPLCFIVDPLDGTKEFIKRNGEFTVNIALSCYGNSIMGVIGVPVTGVIYTAAKGEGAYRYSPDGSREKLSVSDRVDSLTLMCSRSHSDTAMEALISANKNKIAAMLSVGSSLKGCRVAEGVGDVYYRTGYTMEWDTAAMQCITEEAGGIFRQLDGSPMRYNRKNSLNDKGFYILNRQDNAFVIPPEREGSDDTSR